MMKYPNIEAERVRAGLTRRHVALYLGVSRDVYCAWIDGQYPIPSNFCMGLSALFNCSVDYLLATDSRYERWRQYRAV